ncbi:MAG: hypothetical protein EOO22_00780 [Comamonadaceae bacterium]|nr:MAG: hypothetical protein EOO22_00780 [Comamonadaceae bacterium]
MDTRVIGKKVLHEKVAQFIISCAIFFTGPAAHALAGLSRACSMAELSDAYLLRPALGLFSYLGMPPKYLNLVSAPRDQLEKHWVMESIAADYGSLRYYLFAENRVYWHDINPRTGAEENIVFARNFKSPWAAQTLDPAMFPDSALSIFKFNRKILYSARAGHPDIIEQYIRPLGYSNGFSYSLPNPVVYGSHYFYDPASKQTGRLPNSLATNCNLRTWGIEDR